MPFKPATASGALQVGNDIAEHSKIQSLGTNEANVVTEKIQWPDPGLQHYRAAFNHFWFSKVFRRSRTLKSEREGSRKPKSMFSLRRSKVEQEETKVKARGVPGASIPQRPTQPLRYQIQAPQNSDARLIPNTYVSRDAILPAESKGSEVIRLQKRADLNSTLPPSAVTEPEISCSTQIHTEDIIAGADRASALSDQQNRQVLHAESESSSTGEEIAESRLTYIVTKEHQNVPSIRVTSTTVELSKRVIPHSSSDELSVRSDFSANHRFLHQDCRFSPSRSPHGSTISTILTSEVEDASRAWELALQAYAAEANSSGAGSRRSKFGHQRTSSNTSQNGERKDIDPRVTLATPLLPIAGHAGGDDHSLSLGPHHNDGSKQSRPSNHQANQRIGQSAKETPCRCSCQSWTRFPSHTREERNGSAGEADGVFAFDFAYLQPPMQQEVETSRHKGKCRWKAFKRKWSWVQWKRKHMIQKNAWLRFDRGFRSSISTGGVLTHPDLELLPRLTRVTADSDVNRGEYTHVGHC